MKTKLAKLGATIAISAAAVGFFSAMPMSEAEAAKLPKQAVCHVTGSAKKPVVMVKVSGNAVPAHLAHGDYLAYVLTDGSVTCTAPVVPPI